MLCRVVFCWFVLGWFVSCCVGLVCVVVLGWFVSCCIMLVCVVWYCVELVSVVSYCIVPQTEAASTFKGITEDKTSHSRSTLNVFHTLDVIGKVTTYGKCGYPVHNTSAAILYIAVLSYSLWLSCV